LQLGCHCAREPLAYQIKAVYDIESRPSEIGVNISTLTDQHPTPADEREVHSPPQGAGNRIIFEERMFAKRRRSLFNGCAEHQ
jgi:hypothetical protein